MYYILFNLLSLSFCFFYDKLSIKLLERLFLIFLFVFTISILPGFQYGVGTDYFSYENIYSDQSELDAIYKKNEFAFYYLVEFAKSSLLGFKGFVFVLSLLYSLLIAFLLIYFSKRSNIYLCVTFFAFFTITNLMHTQMNLFRASFAMYLFSIAVLFYADKKRFISLVVSFVSIFFHMSAILFLPLFLVPLKFWRFCYRNALSIYVIVFLSISLLPLNDILFFIVEHLAPNYSFYLNGLAPEVSVLNILSKLYYFPLHLLFIYFVHKKRMCLNDFGVILIGFWSLVANFYLFMIDFDFFSRVNYFFVFFYILPIVYLLQYCIDSKRWILFFLICIYIFTPYSVKVLFFSVAEFSYRTYLF